MVSYHPGSNVSNHLWWCAETCEGNKELLREKWISIVHHTANIHFWDSADVYHECPHPPIPRDEARKKRWLRPGSAAHDALREVVFDKNLFKISGLILRTVCQTFHIFYLSLTNFQHFPTPVVFSQDVPVLENATVKFQAFFSFSRTGTNPATVAYDIVGSRDGRTNQSQGPESSIVVGLFFRFCFRLRSFERSHKRNGCSYYSKLSENEP